MNKYVEATITNTKETGLLQKYTKRAKHFKGIVKDLYLFCSRCEKKQYDTSRLPSASAIICFHETELLEYLLHTVHSIVQNSPRQLLQEIILIDDNSHSGMYYS